MRTQYPLCLLVVLFHTTMFGMFGD
uniref:Uncharacterized protein n=1 Tax=Arundo donax TaxID=35708 RepID=A0A0A9GF65_ARUDO